MGGHGEEGREEGMLEAKRSESKDDHAQKKRMAPPGGGTPKLNSGLAVRVGS